MILQLTNCTEDDLKGIHSECQASKENTKRDPKRLQDIVKRAQKRSPSPRKARSKSYTSKEIVSDDSSTQSEEENPREDIFSETLDSTSDHQTSIGGDENEDDTHNSGDLDANPLDEDIEEEDEEDDDDNAFAKDEQQNKRTGRKATKEIKSFLMTQMKKAFKGL